MKAIVTYKRRGITKEFDFPFEIFTEDIISIDVKPSTNITTEVLNKISEEIDASLEAFEATSIKPIEITEPLITGTAGEIQLGEETKEVFYEPSVDRRREPKAPLASPTFKAEDTYTLKEFNEALHKEGLFDKNDLFEAYNAGFAARKVYDKNDIYISPSEWYQEKYKKPFKDE